jgi:hypothetical protein
MNESPPDPNAGVAQVLQGPRCGRVVLGENFQSYSAVLLCLLTEADSGCPTR